MNQKDFRETITEGMMLYQVHKTGSSASKDDEVFSSEQVIVSKKGKTVFYVKDIGDHDEDYRGRKVSLKGANSFPLVVDDRFGGWLGIDYITNDPYLAKKYQQSYLKAKRLQEDIDVLYKTFVSESNNKQKEQLKAFLEENFKF